ncbi:MAG: radical SAM protein, partial [Epsilonproteobacteria bacterium]|nr:radical SAM protein [Campylobacterota bacterium]
MKTIEQQRIDQLAESLGLLSVVPTSITHFFKTKKNLYVYDAPTNEILRFDKKSQLLIKEMYDNSLNDILQNIYNKECLEELKGKISYLKKIGIFKSKFDFPISIPYNDNELLIFLRSQMDNLLLEVTQNCNFRCKYCTYTGNYFHQRIHSFKKMDKNIAKSAIMLFSKRCKDEINIGFYGGEPLSNFEIIKYSIEICQKVFSNKKIFYYITTNGSLIDQEIAGFLRQHNFFIHISLDGTSEIQNKWRCTMQYGPTYNLTMKGIKTLYEYDPDYFKKNVRFQSVLAPPYPYKEISKFFQEQEIIKNCELLVHHVNTFETTIDYSLADKEKKKALAERRWLKEQYKGSILSNTRNKLGAAMFDDALRKIHSRVMNQILIHWVNGICVPSMAKLFVNANGTFYMCEMIGEIVP